MNLCHFDQWGGEKKNTWERPKSPTPKTLIRTRVLIWMIFKITSVVSIKMMDYLCMDQHLLMLSFSLPHVCLRSECSICALHKKYPHRLSQKSCTIDYFPYLFYFIYWKISHTIIFTILWQMCISLNASVLSCFIWWPSFLKNIYVWQNFTVFSISVRTFFDEIFLRCSIRHCSVEWLYQFLDTILHDFFSFHWGNLNLYSSKIALE